MLKPLLTCAAGAAVFFATVAMGQTPADETESLVQKWMIQNKVTQNTVGETWTRVAATLDGVHMRRNRLENPIKAPNNKTKTVVIRLELFRPMADKLGQISSIATDYDLNCLNMTYRDAATNAYPNHNLTGKPRTEVYTDDRWGPVSADPIMGAVAKDVCPNVTGITGVGGMLGGTFGGGGRMDGNSPGAPTGR